MGRDGPPTRPRRTADTSRWGRLAQPGREPRRGRSRRVSEAVPRLVNICVLESLELDLRRGGDADAQPRDRSDEQAERAAGGDVRDVYIVGVSQAPVTRDTSIRGRYVAASVVREALTDAGIDKDRVDALYVGNMTSGLLAGQQQLGGLIADYAELSGVDAVTVEAACASGAAAARMAYQTIAGGINDVVVVCGVERMTHVDRDTVTRALATAADWELEGARGESFMSLNAQLMRHYMDRYGARPEDFAPFSINAHKNALANPNAVFHKPVDLESYMASRVVIDPIRVLDSSPVCNG